jgi:hypothetical protein
MAVERPRRVEVAPFPPIGGWSPLSLMSVEVIVGGMSQRPRIVDGQVAVRDVLDLTLAIDHNVVDGGARRPFRRRVPQTPRKRRRDLAVQLITETAAAAAQCSGRWQAPPLKIFLE